MTIEIAVFSALGLLVGILVFIWLMTRIRYRIGSRHVKVLLFGVPIRRLALGNIDSVSKRRGPGLAEHWWCTTHPKHRMLVLRRKRGLFKNFVITPKNRYVFKTDLERALRRSGVAPSVIVDESLNAEAENPPANAETNPPAPAPSATVSAVEKTD